MLGKLARVFDRYADQRLRLAAPGGDLRDDRGRILARIDRQRVVRNRLVLEGWTEARRIGAVLNRTQAWTTPDLAQPGGSARGFTLDLPFAPGPLHILAEMPGDAGLVSAALPGFPVRRVAWARALLWLPYLWTVARLLPQVWRWRRHGDPAARDAIREGLLLVAASDAVEMDAAAILGPIVPPGTVPPAFRAVTIVMPVFDAFEVTTEALARVARHTGGPDGMDGWRLIVVEDASRDPRLRPWLAAWAAAPAQAGRVQLILNDANLGFVGSVNRGLAAARVWPDDPVILLNSDVLVPAGWAARLIAPLAAPGVASTTPMSNDAEILTVPAICRPGPLPPGAVDLIDAAARRLPAGNVVLPTGVGFCMALAPRFVARLPDFDTAFGRGYGEETDWCQRARALGGRHLAVANLFVEHRGGASFGSPDKQRLLAANGALISARYPGYDREVQDFIRTDPLVAPRLALGLAWAAASAAASAETAAVPVYLAHAMGGGAETDLQRRIAADGTAVVLRVGQGHRWRIEMHSAQGAVQGLTRDEALLRALLAGLPRRHIVYSCGVGDPDPVALPGLLLDLAGRTRPAGRPLPGGPQPIEVLLHDFFPVSPSYTLLGQDGVYRGVPRPDGPAGADPAHRTEALHGRVVDLAAWQAAWGALLAEADTITAFSASSRAILAEAYPAAAAATRVQPHAASAIPRIAAAKGAGGRPVIGVLGNIGRHKGVVVLQRLARDLAQTRRADLVVIGQVDPAYPLAAPAHIHGSYEHRDLPGLVARYGISLWLIPSVWPETFSFTTHEALATGMPVFAFDLGAQAEALRAALAAGAPGGVLPLSGDGAIRLQDLLEHVDPTGAGGTP